MLPVAGTWTIDAGHSSLAFEARHMVVTRMRGRFRSFSGEFDIAEKPEDSSVEVSINAASLDTTNNAADESLKGDKFLDVERFPTLHYRSTEVHHVEGSRWQVDGDLTIKGLTRPITLDATFEGAVAAGRAARAKMAFVARGEFDRRDYGMDFNMAVPSGGWIVGNRVRLDLDVEANLP
jgi:polyisoprenoid-binding protein YceI